MNHMLDLETMSTKTDAAIVQIANVIINFNTGEIVNEFYCEVSLESSVKCGGTMSASTVLFWMRQPDEAREALQRGCSIQEALKKLTEFMDSIDSIKNRKVWGNGAAFDAPILRSAYERLGLETPWSFRNEKCYRTVADMHPNIPIVYKGIKHNALSDAKNQAKHLTKIIKS